ncbi:MAG: ABC transporter permease [Longimicrobiales bacterium]
MSDAPRRTPLALRIAASLLPSDAREDVLGDLVESWRERQASHGRTSAWLWTIRQPLVSIGARLAFRSRMPRTLRAGAGIGFSWIDVRLGVRMLWKQPILTIVAGLTLALGIPAALIPTHTLNVLDSDLPVEEGDRILGLRNWDIQRDTQAPQILHDFTVWRETLTSFQEIGAVRPTSWNVHSADGRAAEVVGAEVTASVFSILRVPPLEGRVLLPSDEVEGAPDVVVISADLWASRFAGDPEIVGRTIDIGRRPHTVVGVMPEGFYFPSREYLWLPLRANATNYPVGGGPELLALGRLAEGVSKSEASVELETVGARLRATWPETHDALRAETISFSLMLVGEIPKDLGASREFMMVQLLCLVLLAVACGNVGTLILARTAMRLNEISVRTALGASRVRILSQLFVESLVLAVGATAVGLILAQTLAKGVVDTMLEGELPYWIDLHLTGGSIALALGLAAACALLAGVLPAIKATSPRIQQNLQRHGRGATVRFGAFTTVLIVAEVALSMGFLTFGTGAVATYLIDQPEGYDVPLDPFLTTGFRTPGSDPTESKRDDYEREFRIRVAQNQEALRDRLAADPAVRRVAMAAQTTGMEYPARAITLESGQPWPGGPVNAGRVHIDYFRDLGIEVLYGRGFTADDVATGPGAPYPSVVVNEDFAESLFGSGNAVGRRVRYTSAPEPAPWYEIVGVVEAFEPDLVDAERRPVLYHPLASADLNPMRYVIEADGPAEDFLPRLRSIAADVDPDAVIENAYSADYLVGRRELENRLLALFVFILSAVGMMLAASGLYALVSFTVSQRTREIGIRTALGAAASDIVLTIARRALVQVLIGVALGSILASWALEDELSMPNAPRLIAGVAVAVVVFAALSCLSPIRRGLRIQPTEALKEA